MEKKDNLDLLIIKATEAIVEEEANAFCSVPKGGEISPVIKKRFHKIRKNNESRNYSDRKKVILIAALIAIIIFLTACAVIPAVRNKIKEMIVMVNDKFFSVSFHSSATNGKDDIADNLPYATTTESASVETNAPPSNTRIDPPKTIRQKAYVSYLPGVYTPEIKKDMKMYYEILYNCENPNLTFNMFQKVITDNNETWINSEVDASKVYINGYPGVVINNEENHYTLTWQTDEYLFILNGYFQSIDILIKIAESVELS